MTSLLEAIAQRIFQAKGAIFEGDVFSILLYCLYTVRAFEFGTVDGGMVLRGQFEKGSDYARRLWEILSSEQEEDIELLLFDIKSTVAGEAGSQAYITPIHQRRIVAFYIGVCAANATFVDLIPNFLQEAEALESKSPTDKPQGRAEKEVAVNVTRVSCLPASAYGGIDQCMSPYRMPLWVLPEAIELVRECAIDPSKVYINPWTRVAFPNWRLLTTTITSYLRPSQDTAHFSAYRVVMDILTKLISIPDSGLKLELVGLQPRLADFRLNGKLVQQKVDEHRRAPNSLLDQVQIARGDEENRGFFFSAFDRFDFLWYQFCFAKHRGSVEEEDIFFLIPERKLPNEWFSTHDRFASFEGLGLEPFRILMDRDGEWIEKVKQILADHPEPRSKHERPLRRSSGGAPIDADVEIDNPASLGEELDQSGRPGNAGRKEYKEIVALGQRRFFYQLMKQCALRRSGLLLVLATNHPAADFDFCRYGWTEEERDAFLTSGRVPRCAQHLSPDVEGIPICYYTQYAESNYQGPMVRARQFRRLDSCKQPRLLAWDIGGYDTRGNNTTPLIIPTDDISASAAQRATFKKALTEKANTPLLSSLLNTGKHLEQYSVEHLGPLGVGDGAWASLWELLDGFTRTAELHHPAGCPREPSNYRWTLQGLNQRLAEQQHYEGVYGDVFAEE